MADFESKNRAGHYIQQKTGYKAFLPKALPPQLKLDRETIVLLSHADRALGKLNGLASIIRNPDLFVYLYVRKEALLSSQIEGTQCSLEDIFYETSHPSEKHDDIQEVSNYVSALNKGLIELNRLPVSSRLLKLLHKNLLENTRGQHKDPGHYRKTQNWIGAPGGSLNNAQFIPPPPHEVEKCMGELEHYIHHNDRLPPLIKAGLIHAQFETIHPFLDGNGRLGRLLIILLLCSWKVIDRPLLYLSYFFKANKIEYYAKLTEIRSKGQWEHWIKFFLQGVIESSTMANDTAIAIHKRHQEDLELIRQSNSTKVMQDIFYHLTTNPIINVKHLKSNMPESSIPTIQRSINKLVNLKILKETTGKKRNRLYTYTQYLEILTRDTK